MEFCEQQKAHANMRKCTVSPELSLLSSRNVSRGRHRSNIRPLVMLNKAVLAFILQPRPLSYDLDSLNSFTVTVTPQSVL